MEEFYAVGVTSMLSLGFGFVLLASQMLYLEHMENNMTLVSNAFEYGIFEVCYICEKILIK